MGLTSPEDEASDEEWTAFKRAVHEKLGLTFDPECRDRLQDPNYIISLKLPVNYGPRSHMTYCNYGYQRLKDIIDAVTGEPIDQFAQRVLFHPLGMHDTYWRVPKEKWGRILGRNEKCMGFPWINSEASHQNESGSGGLKTTPNDITRFCQMILNGGELNGVRVLSKASVREMTANHNDGMSLKGNTDWSAWGLGWNIRCDKMDDSGCLRSPGCLDHGGWAGHKIFADPETGLVFAMYGGEYNPRDMKPGSRPFTWLGEVSNVLYSALD